jgi:hypothetical protein
MQDGRLINKGDIKIKDRKVQDLRDARQADPDAG